MSEVDRAPRIVQRVFYWAWAGMMILALLMAMAHAFLG